MQAIKLVNNAIKHEKQKFISLRMAIWLHGHT